MPSLGRWKYSVNASATLQAYARARGGGADTCGCVTCRNFRLARGRVFPAEFIALLGQLGVDPHKDAEVYHSTRVALGQHDYGGWYHFVGTLNATGDFAPIDFGGGFTVRMCGASAPRLASLKEMPVVQLEFHAGHVPWLLDEPEPA